MEDSKFVKDITEKEGKKKYWQITWHDDKKDNIFNPDWLKLLEQAHLENRIVDFKKEKSGNYWNIVELKLGDFTDAPVKKLAEPKDKMTPDDWDRKQKIERESIESQTAYKGIMQLASSGQGEIIENTKLHEAFNVALDWALARLSTTPPKQPAPKATTEPKKQKEEVDEVNKLYNWVAENMKWKSSASSRSFIVNKCGVGMGRIDTEPLVVMKEIAELQGWSL